MNEKAAFALELARRFDGYLVQLDATIVEMLEAGLITTIYAGEGYVIARAVAIPMPPSLRAPNGKWTRFCAFPREAKGSVA